MSSDPLDGLAFDTNLLNRPTQRRLMSLWMESAGAKVLLLPEVVSELKAPNRTGAARARAINAAHAEAWDGAVAMQEGPFAKIELTPAQEELSNEILHGFTLACFPRLATTDEILALPDAVILAQGLAARVDCVVSNNMRSIDHHEVNDLVRRTLGGNADFVRTADDAMLEAHCGGEASRELLTLSLASCWPDDGAELTIGEAHNRLERLCNRLRMGVNMPQVAQRLLNTFEIDVALEEILEQAWALARESQALLCERQRMASVTGADETS